MKKIIGLFFVLAIISAKGQSSQGRYASRITPDGTIFFTNPQKLNVYENILRFEYDMTLLSWTDSVTVNFTFESKLMYAPENLNIICGNTIYECDDFSVLFIDIKKNHYKIRVTSKFPVSVISKMLESEKSPVFTFTQENILEKAAYGENIWQKDRKRLLDIFKLYVYSKK